MPSWCRHYPNGGMGDNTHCNLGIEMRSLRDTSAVPHRFPCYTAGAEHLCASYEGYTAEEIKAEEDEIKSLMAKMDALWTRESEVCPQCGKHVESMRQVGRCVYASCGCRQGQGQLHAAWKTVVETQPDPANDPEAEYWGYSIYDDDEEDEEDFEPNEDTEMFCDWGDDDFDEGFDDIPFPDASPNEADEADAGYADFDAIVASAGNWCECGIPREACHIHSKKDA